MEKGTKKKVIQMFSIHGLLRANDLEMGRDADTGGQIKYVVELGAHLGQREDVERVDLFTRLLDDKTVSDDYSVPFEQVSDRFRIVRIQCGGRKYFRKELLWPHLDEFIDKVIKLNKKEGTVPDIVHGHYADAGYVGMRLAELYRVPFVFTGHSLGRSKREKLLRGGMKEKEIVRKFKIDRRIQAEEDVLGTADLVITSTSQEIEKQYGMYDNRKQPSYKVIPPGLDIDKFYAYYHDSLPEKQKDEQTQRARASVNEELDRFLTHTDKPLVLALCRPEKRKNISGLIKAYGEDKELRSMANLAIFAGLRKDIADLEDNERDVLTEMLLLMDKYNLYGKMAIPKSINFQQEVPALYRVAARKRGVFVNPALTEPFGLTLIEAAASGLPIVATNDGGPRDIMENCNNGILVDPTDSAAIAGAVRSIISDEEKWKQYSENGVVSVRKHYTWDAHVDKYLAQAGKLMKGKPAREAEARIEDQPIGRRLNKLRYFLITDIDNTLLGGDKKELEELIALLRRHRGVIGFGVATGRTVDSAAEYLEDNGVPVPDIMINSVGAEVYYGKKRLYDQGWETHIGKRWDRDKIVSLLEEFRFLEYQPEEEQRPFKVSYYMKPGKDRLTSIHHTLDSNRCDYNLIYSTGKDLDILPGKASKGKAIRYLSYKWDIPLRNFLVCGDSGNDEEMLRGGTRAVVVGNYSRELEDLRGEKNILFAGGEYAGGIVEALEHYRLIEKADRT